MSATPAPDHAAPTPARDEVAPVVVVDDTVATRKLLARLVAQAGCDAVPFGAGEEALEYLTTHPASLVLLDVRLPGISGLDVLRRLRKRWADADMPVVMVTAYGDREAIVSAFSLGASDYITKPFDTHVALARIRTHLSRKLAEDRLRASEERYALAARGANDGLWDWDLIHNRMHVSTRWKAIVGCEDDELEAGLDGWLRRVHGDDLARMRRALDEHLEGRTAHYECEYRIRHKDGTFRWVRTRGLAVRNAAGNVVRMAGSQCDITEGKVVDDLTGLSNRVLLLERLEGLFRAPCRTGLRAVLFLDLDGFKLINDGYGHIFGDEVLKIVARRLRECVRLDDEIWRVPHDGIDERGAGVTLSRLGGDEFVVLLDSVPDVSACTVIAERIQRALSMPMAVHGREVCTNTSIGIAIDTGSYARAEELLRDADTAMYRAKALGKGRSMLFDAEMREQLLQRVQLEVEVRRGVERDEFVSYFQPIVDLHTYRWIGLETLIRWQRPSRRVASPAEFLPVLEDANLIQKVGRQLFDDACRQLRQWRDAHPMLPLMITFNVGRAQLAEGDLLHVLRQAVDRWDLQTNDVVVEIAESAAAADLKQAADVLRAVRGAGFAIILDHFATGSSALAWLHELPVTGIKLDRSYAAADDPKHAAVVRAMVRLARELNLTVIAEGVERPAQCHRLRELGCTLGQGHLLGPPESAAVITRRLREGGSAPVPGEASLSDASDGRTA